MVARKRPAAAAALDARGLAAFRKRLRIGSTADYEASTSPLGEGGFGSVYKARHRATNETVAIKVLSSGADEAAPDAGALLREAKLLEASSADNPHLVGFRGMVRDPSAGDLRLVMEYAGRSLHDALLERGSLPEAEVRAVMLQLLSGARTMHGRRVVHRDIKPANVLVDESGRRAKLCDLGLAMSLAEPQPYAKVGTITYMAPEMLLGKADYGAPVDAWALGCVMAELLTGRELFAQGEDDKEQLVPSKERFPGDDTECVEQLGIIFGVLGAPDRRKWPGFKSLPLAAGVPCGSPLEQSNRLGELFPEEVLSDDGFEVLQGLLTCNPNKRLTAAAALKRPWFAAPRPAKVDETVLLRKKVAPVLPEEKNALKIHRAILNAQAV